VKEAKYQPIMQSRNASNLLNNHFATAFRLPFIALFLCCVLSLTHGCGYQFRASGEPIGSEIQSLAIPLISSTASSLGFEGIVTNIIREEFVSRSKLPLVSREKASAVFIGRISEIMIEPSSYDTLFADVRGKETEYDVTDRRRLRITLDATLIDAASGNPIWREKAMKERASYEVTGDPLTNRFNVESALEEIARRFAERIYAQTVERF
jgi:hypothetical protein